MKLPKIINGDCHADHRGRLFYNNNFDATSIKRIYILENSTDAFLRGWQGHKIEQRWFSALTGSFKIQLIKIENWELPRKNSEVIEYVLTADKLNILHIPKGYVTSIQAIDKGSKLLAMADYLLGEIKDEYRYPIDYFEKG